MFSFMTRVAQPNHLQRLAIVWMVAVWCAYESASSAMVGTLQLPLFHSLVNLLSSEHLLSVLCIVFSVCALANLRVQRVVLSSPLSFFYALLRGSLLSPLAHVFVEMVAVISRPFLVVRKYLLPVSFVGFESGFFGFVGHEGILP